MSLIKRNQSFRPGTGVGKAKPKPLDTNNPVQIPTTQVKSTPTESVTLTKVEVPGTKPAVKPIKKPRPGSDMEAMVDSMKENGHLTHTPVADKPPEKKTPRAGSDMAQMLESIESPNLGATFRPAVGANGTIVMLDEASLVGKESQAKSPLESGKTFAERLKEASKQDAGHDAHGHGHGHTHDALLAKHLGTEIVEQMGHHATHASHGAGHVAEGVGQVAEGATHGVKQVATQAAKQVSHHGSAAKTGLAHGADLGHAADLSHATDAAQSVKDVAHHATKGAHHASELTEGLATALKVGSGASFALAIPLTYMGVKETAKGASEVKQAKAELKQAQVQGDDAGVKAAKEKRNDGYAVVAEGVGTTAVGIRSGAAGAVMAGMVSSAPVVADVAAVAYKTLTPLGLIHAGVDVGLGVRDMAKGNKEIKQAKAEGNEEAKKAGRSKVVDGALKVGFGVAVGAAALGGGIPAIATAITILGVKTGRKVAKHFKEKKAAKAAQQQNPPQVVAADTGVEQTSATKGTRGSPPLEATT